MWRAMTFAGFKEAAESHRNLDQTPKLQTSGH
jgi:hypothetical protein